MFNRYWREYPWWMQLMQFVLMLFIFLGFVSALMYALPNIVGVPATAIAEVSETSPRSHITAALFFQGLSSVFVFLFPPLLFAYVTHPRPKSYLGLRQPGKPVHWLLVVLIMVSLMPVLIYIAGLLSHFNFGESARKLQQENDRMVNAFLSMKSLSDMFLSFLVIAIIPAIGEELLFRGVMMRFAAKRSRGPIFPIIASSVMFAVAHINPQGMPSIFIAGAVLAIIYYLTGSLWCSILGHLINNGLQIILVFASSQSSALHGMIQEDSIPVQYALIGLVLFVVSFYLLWKNRTPLPSTWSADFTADELVEMQKDQNDNINKFL